MSEQENKLTMRDVILEASQATQGIEDHKKGIQNLTSSVSNHLLTCAKGIGSSDVEGEDKSSLFMAACTVQESFIKSDEAGKDKLDKLPRCWINPKSNIKAAIDLGVDLDKYLTESDLRKDLTKLRQAQEVLEGEESETVDPMPQAIVDSENHVFTSRVNALLAELAIASKLDDDVIDTVVDELENTIETIKILIHLVPQKPEKEVEVAVS